jgi:cytochrome c-type biogenesis protein CcmH|tara:strand:- start:21 stop:542 length:522 start_codon:yes stop_codon:yes gene_type:complete
MKIKKNFLLAGLLLLAIPITLIACSTEEKILNTQRINSLNKSLMCPVCPGESIDQSQNTLALQMRDIVVVKINEGKTDQEIKEYFVSKYGPVVLMEPPKKGIGLLAWVFPPILFIITIAVVYFILFSLKKRSRKLQDNNKNLTEEELQILQILQKETLSQEDIYSISKINGEK